ncbi:hypothetical protein AMECASPLE_029935 [Ameca splendens]|uniref:Uncharacterized protein n=1 Tax=Ameca splendens TaxID=208324 RepID=A0ABV0YI40_9TELE
MRRFIEARLLRGVSPTDFSMGFLSAGHQSRITSVSGDKSSDRSFLTASEQTCWEKLHFWPEGPPDNEYPPIKRIRLILHKASPSSCLSACYPPPQRLALKDGETAARQGAAHTQQAK